MDDLDGSEANWCPDCGEPRGVCSCGEWEDDTTWTFDIDQVCVNCGSRAFEDCGFCGNPLCPMCSETGGGFCDGPHTNDQVEAYGRMLRGGP